MSERRRGEVGMRAYHFHFLSDRCCCHCCPEGGVLVVGSALVIVVVLSL